MSETDAGAKTHDPTPQRLERARREGDVAQSREANAAAAYVAFYGVVLAGAGWTATSLASLLRALHADPQGAGALAFASQDFLGALLAAIAPAAAPALLVPAVAVALALVAQNAVAPALGKLQPKWSRLDVVANARSKFGGAGLVEFLKSALKLALISALFGVFVAMRFDTLPGAALLAAEAASGVLYENAVLFVGLIALFSVATATIDLPLVQAQYKKRLRMSLEELKKEAKETEGDPYVKRSRREKGRLIATNRMLNDVPKASVVIVNPTHYAVALSWSRHSGKAPVCVAKGVDEIAMRIREVAAAKGVPLRRDAAAARAIYATVEIGAEIKRSHFAAVAAAIRFAEDVRRTVRR